MSAGVSTYGGCPECGESQRHKPLCSVNIDVTHELAADISRDIEKLAVSQKRLRDLLDEIRRAREDENRQAVGLAVGEVEWNKPVQVEPGRTYQFPDGVTSVDLYPDGSLPDGLVRRADGLKTVRLGDELDAAPRAKIGEIGGIPIVADPSVPEGQFRIEQTDTRTDLDGDGRWTGTVGDVIGETGNVREAHPPHPLGGGEC